MSAKISAVLLAATAIAFGAPAARAGLIISSTRTAGTTFDEVQFHISGFDGADLTYVPTSATNVDGVSGIQGTFSAVGTGSLLSVPNAARTVNGFAGFANQTYVNFDSTISPTRSPNTATPTTLTGTWYTTGDGSVGGTRLRPVDTSTGPLDDGIDETLLADVFVTKGTDISFAGFESTYAAVNQPLNFGTAVPEPASLGLLGVVAATALRRRRA